MKHDPGVSSNFSYGRKLVGSSVRGAGSGGRRSFEDEPLAALVSRSVRESLVTAAMGAGIGFLASLWRGDGKAPRSAARGCLVGGALGFSAGVLWGSRNMTGAVVRGAVHGVNAAREERWLERNPINYA